MNVHLELFQYKKYLSNSPEITGTFHISQKLLTLFIIYGNLFADYIDTYICLLLTCCTAHFKRRKTNPYIINQIPTRTTPQKTWKSQTSKKSEADAFEENITGISSIKYLWIR